VPLAQAQQCHWHKHSSATGKRIAVPLAQAQQCHWHKHSKGSKTKLKDVAEITDHTKNKAQ
jgi:hypothetical protein